MSERSMINDYTAGPIGRQLLNFAWPFMLSNLLQTAYNLVDMVVVGQFVGPAGLSAVSIGGDVIHLYTFVAVGLCNAGQIMISQYIGLKDKNAVSKTVGAMFTAVLSLSLLLTAGGILWLDPALRALNVPAEAWADCRAYTLCGTVGLFFIFGYVMISSVLRGMGDSRRPLLFIGIAAVGNIVLDLLFVAGFGMGAFGASLATVLSQALSFVIAVVYLYRRRQAFGFDFAPKSFIPEPAKLGFLLKLGVPMMLQSIAISISALFVSSCINSYGVTASAVTGVGNKLSAVVSIVTLALAQAGATVIGQNFAARKFDRVSRALGVALAAGCGFAGLLSLCMLLWPAQVFSLFNSDPEVLAMSRAYAIIAVVNFFGWALRGPSLALCNGMGFPAMNFSLGILDGVVMRIGLCILLGQTLGMGIHGFWLGSAIAGYAFFLVMFPYFLSGRWKKRIPPVAKGQPPQAAQ